MRFLLLPLACCLLPSCNSEGAKTGSSGPVSFSSPRSYSDSIRFTIWILNLPVGPPLHLAPAR